MLEHTLTALKSLPKEYAVLLMGAAPVGELRVAIPLGLYLGLSPVKTFIIAVVGNIIPVLPILFFLKPISDRLRQFKIFARFFDWLFERARKKAVSVQKYEFWGLAIFVAIPLPMTGAWTGAIIASLFKMRIRDAFISITIGVIGAGIIVSTLCILGIMSWKAVIN